MGNNRILYARFRSGLRFYIYDRYSNHILEVPEKLWQRFDASMGELEDRPERSSVGVPVRGNGANIVAPATLAAADDIPAAQASGYLKETTITAMEFCSRDTLRSMIDTQIPQLTLELTERCSARCHYCRQGYDISRSRYPQAMDWSTAARAVDCFMSHSSQTKERAISFWGGEPLLEHELQRRVIDYVSCQYPLAPVRYSFTTNAMPMTTEIARYLLAHDVHLLVSLDGPGHIHDRHRVTASGEGTFSRTKTGLSCLKTTDDDYYRRHVWFNCVLTPGTRLREVARFFAEDELVRGHKVLFSAASSYGNSFYSDFGNFTDAELDETRVTWREALLSPNEPESQVLRDTALKRFVRLALRPRGPIGPTIPLNGSCVPLLKKMHVTVDGRIHLCERVDRDNAVGDVVRGIDHDAVWRLVSEYSTNSLPECSNCWAVRLCGACYRDFTKFGRWLPSRRDHRCTSIRRATLELLEDYAQVLEKDPGAFADLADSSYWES